MDDLPTFGRPTMTTRGRIADEGLGHDRGTQQRRIALDRLPQIIDAVKARGLRFVTVSELIAPTSP